MTLHELRQEVATALTAAGIQASAFMPEVIDPPIALVGPASTYVQPVEFKTFKAGAFGVSLEVTLIAAIGINEVTTTQMDEFIETALRALCVDHDWQLVSVNEPGTLEGTNYLATNITINNRLEV